MGRLLPPVRARPDCLESMAVVGSACLSACERTQIEPKPEQQQTVSGQPESARSSHGSTAGAETAEGRGKALLVQQYVVVHQSYCTWADVEDVYPVVSQNWIVANLTLLCGSSGSEVRRVVDAARGDRDLGGRWTPR
jgi:hypothetical protein